MSMEKDEKIAEQSREISKFAEVLETLEQQASMSGMDEDRLNSIEAMFSELQDEKEKTHKLLLALAEHKRQTTLAESAKEQEAARSQALEEQLLQMAARIEKGSQDSTSQAIEAEKLQQELLEANTTLGKTESELSAVQRQLDHIDEQNQLMSNKFEQKGVQMLELKLELAQEKSSAQEALLEQNALHASTDSQKVQLQSKEAQLEAIQGLVKEKEEAIGKYQRTITRQEVKIQEFRSQVFNLERQALDLRSQTSSDEMQKLHAAQAQALEKELEVCDLQKQLAEELARRQTMQYELIQQEKQTIEVQEEILFRHNIGSSIRGTHTPVSLSVCGSVCGEQPIDPTSDSVLTTATSGMSVQLSPGLSGSMHVRPGQVIRQSFHKASDQKARLACLDDRIAPDTAVTYHAPSHVLVPGSPIVNAPADRFPLDTAVVHCQTQPHVMTSGMSVMASPPQVFREVHRMTNPLPPKVGSTSPKITSKARGRAPIQGQGTFTRGRVQSPGSPAPSAVQARLAMASKTFT